MYFLLGETGVCAPPPLKLKLLGHGFLKDIFGALVLLHVAHEEKLGLSPTRKPALF